MSHANYPLAHGGACPVSGKVTCPGACHAGKPDEVHVGTLELDAFARLSLSLFRWYFQSFATPASHGWLRAQSLAGVHFPPRRASALCHDIVDIVQCLRITRRSSLSFNSESCNCRRDWLTPDERRLLEVIGHIRRSQSHRALLFAQLLCNGVIGDDLLVHCKHYVDRHAPPLSDLPPTTGQVPKEQTVRRW